MEEKMRLDFGLGPIIIFIIAIVAYFRRVIDFKWLLLILAIIFK